MKKIIAIGLLPFLLLIFSAATPVAKKPASINIFQNQWLSSCLHTGWHFSHPKTRYGKWIFSRYHYRFAQF